MLVLNNRFFKKVLDFCSGMMYSIEREVRWSRG